MQTTSAVTVRRMTVDDLAYASSLTLAENWHSETLEEFEGFFSHAPEGCLIVERDGRPVAIGVATPYRDAGFLGQIVVAPAARGQGVGSLIVDALLSCLQRMGVRSVCLDATEAGAPLYERHGFRKIQPSLRYSGKVRGASHTHVRSMLAGDLDRVCSLDRLWWSQDRRFFLERRWKLYPDLCHVLEQDGAIEGYVLARRRGDKLWIGPWCTATHVAAPEALLEALAPPGAEVQVHAGVLASSTRAVHALDRLGLEQSAAAPWRMVWGPDGALGQRMEVLANGTSAKG